METVYRREDRLMPNYTYYCDKCDKSFEIFFYIRDYKDRVKCKECKNSCSRFYQEDILTISGSVKKSDCELKTLGDLANRNRDKMSQDERNALDQKHNAYKDQESNKELPAGMSRIKKTKNKTRWR